MPAYNYFPATYQPPYGQSFFQNPYTQQQQQQMQPQQQIQTSGIIWVSGDAEADAYPLAPNNAVTLWHRSAPIVYFKQADASGRPSMRIYDLVEHKNVTPVSQAESNDYATKADLNTLESTVRTLQDELKKIQNEMVKNDADE